MRSQLTGKPEASDSTETQRTRGSAPTPFTSGALTLLLDFFVLFNIPKNLKATLCITQRCEFVFHRLAITSLDSIKVDGTPSVLFQMWRAGRGLSTHIVSYPDCGGGVGGTAHFLRWQNKRITFGKRFSPTLPKRPIYAPN